VKSNAIGARRPVACTETTVSRGGSLDDEPVEVVADAATRPDLLSAAVGGEEDAAGGPVVGYRLTGTFILISRLF
jgi:hypothetical protein